MLSCVVRCSGCCCDVVSTETCSPSATSRPERSRASRARNGSSSFLRGGARAKVGPWKEVLGHLIISSAQTNVSWASLLMPVVVVSWCSCSACPRTGNIVVASRACSSASSCIGHPSSSASCSVVRVCRFGSSSTVGAVAVNFLLCCVWGWSRRPTCPSQYTWPSASWLFGDLPFASV